MTKIIDATSKTEIRGRVRWVCVLGDAVAECLTDAQARSAARSGTDRRGLIDGLHAARVAESERASGRRAYATATYYVRDPSGPAEGAWWIVALSA